MPADRSVSYDSGLSGVEVYVIRALPVAALIGIWLWLALSAGGQDARDWAFPAIALGVLGAAAAWLLAYSRRPRQLSLAVLALFAAYAVWVFASNLWGASGSRTWVASGRTFTYLLVLALALAFFTSSRARLAFKHLFLAASLILLVVAIWRLWTAGDLAQLFAANRLVYPVGRADTAAAIFLVPFWPLIWLAAGPDEPAPVRGLALGLATGLVGLALMTQSQAAAWSLGISLIVFFALSPGRLRLLFYLVAPGLLMVYAFPHLNRYWTQNPPVLSGGPAARTLTIAVLAAGFIGMIAALLEDWIKVSGRMKAIFGVVVLAGCAAGLIYGGLTLTKGAGGPMAWFNDRWDRLVTEPAMDGPVAPAPTRADAWQTAWQQVERTPVVGAGADESAAASLVPRVLSDTGIIGGVLVFGAILLSLAGALWPRTAATWNGVRRIRRPSTGPGTAPGAESAQSRAGPRGISRWGRDPLAYGWETALLAGLAYWFVNANLEDLLRTTGITVPILLMLAAVLAAGDARAGALWPRLASWLRRGAAPRMDIASGTATSDGETGGEEKHRRLAFGHLRPEGRLSEGFRLGLIVLSAAVVILAASAYLLALV